MKDAILTFIRAVFWGSLSGGGLFLLVTVPLAIQSFDWSRPQDSLWIAAMPVIVAGTVVVPVSVCVGLPLTDLLAARTREDQAQYLFAGLILGLLLPLAIGLASGGPSDIALLSLSGALAGSVTGAVWGRWREEVADRSASEDAAKP